MINDGQHSLLRTVRDLHIGQILRGSYGLRYSLVPGFLVCSYLDQPVRIENSARKSDKQRQTGDKDRKSRFPVFPIQNVSPFITVRETTVYLVVQIEEDIKRVDVLLTQLLLQPIDSYRIPMLPYTSYFSRLILTSSSVSERGAPSIISRICEGYGSQQIGQRCLSIAAKNVDRRTE